MKLALMQPYFFPYVGYFSLIKHCDRFVLFDTVQYIRGGWIERNRVLKTGEGWRYVSVPVERESMHTLINQAHIRHDPDWKDQIFRYLEHYKKKSPYYREVMALLDNTLDTSERSIARLNERSLRATCEYLGIQRDIQAFSKTGITINEPQKPGDWGLSVCRAVGANEYVNTYGAIELFDPEKYRAAGVPILFLKNNLKRYDQGRDTFEPGLSIIDVLMFNDPKAANELIDDYVTSATGVFPQG